MRDTKRPLWASLFLIAMLACTVTACGGGGGGNDAAPTTSTIQPPPPPPPPPSTGSATLSWQPPTFYVDDTTPLTIQGYRFYAGTSPSDLALVEDVPNGGIATYVITGLSSGTTWYFAVSVYDGQGVESGFSNIAAKTI